MSPKEEERLDVEAAIAALEKALPLQYRSALAYTLAAGSVVGVSHQHLGDTLWRFAALELEDVRRLTEKLVALGGKPPTGVATPCFSSDPHELLGMLIEDEQEAAEALQDCIAPTGREATSEALEHRMEHMIMRKQEQIDLLQRARREPDRRPPSGPPQ